MTDDAFKQFLEQARAFRKDKNGKYPDLLAKPKSVGPFRDQIYREMVDQEMAMRQDMLFLTYDIDPDEPSSWELLARALAERHVPGMRKTSESPKKSKLGRRRTRGLDFLVDLCRAMDVAIALCAEKRGIPVEDVMDKVAVGYLDNAFRERWPQPNGDLLKHTTLRSRYSPVKASWVRVKTRVGTGPWRGKSLATSRSQFWGSD